MTIEQIKNWCNDNEYTIYADYNDQLPLEYAEKILACDSDEKLEQVLCDIECDIDEHLLDYHWQTESEQYQQMLDELGIDDSEEIRDTFNDYFIFNTWEYFKSLFNKTSHIHIVCTPMFDNEYIEAPCVHDHDAEYCKELSDILIKTLGFTQSECDQLARETGYGGTFLRICGNIDFSEMFETRKMPKSITFSKHDSYVFHNSGNGSGSCYEPEIRDKVTLPCEFRIDNDWKYGVDSVYGFTSSFWRNDLTVN